MSFKMGTNLTDRSAILSRTSIDNLSTFTVLMWAYLTTLSANGNLFFYRHIAGTFQKRLLNAGSTGVLRGGVRRAGGVSFADSVAGILKINRWNFVGMTYDPTNGVEIYHGLDYGPVLTARAVGNSKALSSGATNADATSQLWWGGSDDAPTHGDPISGMMAAAGLWNRVMPLNEIRDQQMHMRPTTGCVDFHVFRKTGRTGHIPDQSFKLDGDRALTMNTSMNIQEQSHIHPQEPQVEIL